MRTRLNDSNRNILMKKYLLGEASPEERHDVEERYAADPELFAELVALESDLLDSYARGDLNASEREKLHKSCRGNPERWKRLEFAAALTDHVAAAVKNEPSALARKPAKDSSVSFPAFRILGFACALLLIIAGGLSITSRYRLSRELARISEAQANLVHQQQSLHAEVTEMRNRLQEDIKAIQSHKQAVEIPSSTIASLTLTADLSRGDGKVQLLELPPSSFSVLLLASVNNEKYLSYRVALQTVEGAAVWEQNGLFARRLNKERKVLHVELPSDIFRNTDYILRVSGILSSGEDIEIAAYAFRVQKIGRRPSN